jgi:hypothetical protein
MDLDNNMGMEFLKYSESRLKRKDSGIIKDFDLPP